MRLFSLSFIVLLSGLLVAQRSGEELLVPYLEKNVAGNAVFAEGTTGFYLYDIAADRPLYGYNAEQYFVPASNVKLLTFYLANHLLREGTPAAFYRQSGERTEVWGAGYPLLLHPQFIGYDELGSWLQGQEVPITVHLPAQEAPPRYGAGWSWDDYDYGYVYERSSLPVYGNRLHLELAEPDDYGIQRLYGSPPGIARNLIQDTEQRRAITREEGQNLFTVGKYIYHPDNFPLERALIVSPAATGSQLRGAFGPDRITIGKTVRPAPPEVGTLTVSLPDTVYRRLLQNSDNYLAEQLILQSAAQRYGNFDEATLFDYATDTLFAAFSMGKLRYADGSGLSRYNLVKPRQFGQLVTALYREVGQDRLVDLLPSGGGNGTLEKRFDDQSQTYIWAKTGSLSGVICISGLLRTRSGRWLAFSFMHNNVMGGSRAYYREMERVLGWVYGTL